MTIDGQAFPKERYRGIYKILLYSTELKISGYFKFPSYWKTGIANSRFLWNQASLFIPITDPLGLQSGTVISINGKNREFQQPEGSINGMKSGILVSIPEIRKYKKQGFRYKGTSNYYKDFPEGSLVCIHRSQKPSFGGFLEVPIN